jgi:hypothetical protein
LKWFAYNCTGNYLDYTSKDNPKKVTGAKVGDTLTVAIDLRTDYDNL